MAFCLYCPHTRDYMCLRVWQKEPWYCPIIGYNGKEIRYKDISWLNSQNNIISWRAWNSRKSASEFLLISWEVWNEFVVQEGIEPSGQAGICYHQCVSQTLKLCQATNAMSQFAQLASFLHCLGLFLTRTCRYSHNMWGLIVAENLQHCTAGPHHRAGASKEPCWRSSCARVAWWCGLFS